MITRGMLSVGCHGTVGTHSIKGLGFRVQGLGNNWGSVGLDGGVWLVWQLQVLRVTTCIECKQALRLALMPLLLTFFRKSAHLDCLDLAVAEQRLPLSVGGVDAKGHLPP